MLAASLTPSLLPSHLPNTAALGGSNGGSKPTAPGAEQKREIPSTAARHILELLLHLTQASARVKVDMLAPFAAAAFVTGGEEDGMEQEGGEGEDSLLGHMLDLLAQPAYARHGSRLEALLALVEAVTKTLEHYLTPEERRKGACDCVCIRGGGGGRVGWLVGWLVVVLEGARGDGLFDRCVEVGSVRSDGGSHLIDWLGWQWRSAGRRRRRRRRRAGSRWERRLRRWKA